jgi:8-oxo-dGTP diphosphatase
MKQYVLGFLFGPDGQVVLIEKQRPVWMKGLLNGVGGHIEDFDETPLIAMKREFYEETGVKDLSWEHYATLLGEKFTMFVFKAYGFQQFHDAVSMEDEKIVKIKLRDLPDNAMFNLRWLIPMALDGNIREVQLIKV